MADIFKKWQWEERGVNIDGPKLSNLKYADDIAYCKQSLWIEKNARKVAREGSINSTLNKHKQNKNNDKNKRNKSTKNNITIIGDTIEMVDQCIYLGQTIRIVKEMQYADPNRWIRLEWTPFGELSHILTNKS